MHLMRGLCGSKTHADFRYNLLVPAGLRLLKNLLASFFRTPLHAEIRGISFEAHIHRTALYHVVWSLVLFMLLSFELLRSVPVWACADLAMGVGDLFAQMCNSLE